LSQAVISLIREAEATGCKLIPAGVNPFVAEPEGQLLALCADYHQIEVLDDGEIERIYNLFRQFLAELLAISTHSAVYGMKLQRDFSLRMRVNPTSFLPRYISQFNIKHLDKLRGMMRKDYGLADLQQMDVNPLAGNANRLSFPVQDLLSTSPAAVELRFVDAQIAYPFIRAQIIIFQAIAMYGRSLARLGKRLPYMRDESIDANKALAVQAGPGAVLQPDPKFKKEDGHGGYWYHDQGTSERATTALLTILDGLLMQCLRDLECQYVELAPIVLGAEIRRKGRQCFANYAEFQKYLYYTHGDRFPVVYQQQIDQMLRSPQLDPITEYNAQTYPSMAQEISRIWSDKLTPRTRLRGSVKWYDKRRQEGRIATERGTEIVVRQRDIEGADHLTVGYPVTFELLSRKNEELAVRVRVEALDRQIGEVSSYDDTKGIGFITAAGTRSVFFHRTAVTGNKMPAAGDMVSFEAIQDAKGPRALRVEVLPQPRYRGRVKWFNAEKGYGFIAMDGNGDVYVQRNSIEEGTVLKSNQIVTFELREDTRGSRAVRVRSSEEK
jgi:cold shock CspA family protein